MYIITNADNNAILYHSNRLNECLSWFYKSGFIYVEVWQLRFRERKMEYIEEWTR